jgi:hypothetical protein
MTTAPSSVRRALLVVPLAALLFPLTARAKLPAGTGVTASKTAAGHLTSTSVWTIAKSADPASQMVAAGATATVHWTITTTKSASGAIGAFFDGQVCVTNTGSRATQGLAIQDQLTAAHSTKVLTTVAVDVSAKPQLNPGESYCYPYTITVPSASIVPGAVYKDTAHVTITNQSCCPGTPTGPAPSAAVALPATATAVDSSITVSDTNGQTFGFSSGGSQGYDQTFDCPSSPGTHTLDDTATIESTGQTAEAKASVECIVYPQSNALVRPPLEELAAFGSCVSFFVDDTESECGGCFDDCCPVDCCQQENHHQGLARTPQLSDGSIYFFVSHSEIDSHGTLLSFRWAGPVAGEHVDGPGLTATLDERLPLMDEEHPSDIDFLPDVNHFDSGYLFVANEYDLKKVRVYYWAPQPIGLVEIGTIDPGLAKPSHILIDKVRDHYWLVVLDDTPDGSGVRHATPFRAYYKDLFPSGSQASMDISAFQQLPSFTFKNDVGSQAQLVRDANDDWYVLVYNADEDENDYVYVRNITFADDGTVTLGDGATGPPPPSGATDVVHFFLPAGDTGFSNTGTHYVDRDGHLIIASSERWSQSLDGPFGYETRVDECVPTQ